MGRTADVLVVRVTDWQTSGATLPPWKTEQEQCHVCGQNVVVTPGFREDVEKKGFEVRYICTQCVGKRHG